MSLIHKAQGFAGAPIELMDYVTGLHGDAIEQSSIDEISYTVLECTSEQKAEQAIGEEVASDDLAKSDCVFNTAQTDAPWDATRDPRGYNFRFDSPGTDRPTGGKWHRYDIILTPFEGEAFRLVWIVKTLPIPTPTV